MTAVALFALLCVGLMGFAIQRGGTCTVAAVDEMLSSRKTRRMAAMLEASLWVAGGLALGQLLQLAGSMPAGQGVSRWTFIGAALLGLGAWVNRACVFGAIARLGSGEWAYAVTPLGFYVGCLSVDLLFARPAPELVSQGSPVQGAAVLVAPLFAAFVLWRLWPAVRALRGPQRLTWLRQTVWEPHAATIVIGVSFVFTLLLVGRWAYTDVLADLARQMNALSMLSALPLLLLGALYVGALVGGWTAGRWQSTAPTLSLLLRCFAGGVLMGWGSLLIPGSNDGLILIGIPLLRPYAWLAFATMALAIAVALWAQRARARRSSSTGAARDGGPGTDRVGRART